MTKQASAFVFAAGQTPELWVDGVKNVIGAVGNPAGTLSVTDTLELGRGGANRPGYFKGRCSFLALSSRRQPTEVLSTMTLAFADARRVYGHGTVNRFTDTTKSPVAGFAASDGEAGKAVTINVAAASYDPGGLAMTCTAAAVTAGSGTVTRSGGTITITPSSSASAFDLVACDYTISNSSGKTSSNAVYVTVKSTVDPPTPPVTDVPKLQPDAVITIVANWRTVGFSQSGTKSTHNSGNLRTDLVAAIGVASAGDVIVLADGTYGGAQITCSRNGAAATAGDGSRHIMVRARNHGKAVISCQLNVTGTYWWFTGIKFTFALPVPPGNPNYTSDEQAVLCSNAGLWITNSRFTGYAFIHIYPDNRITNLRFCYNTVNASTPAAATDTGIFITLHDISTPDRAPTDTEIAWNRVTLGVRSSADATSRPIIIGHSSHSTAADQMQFITRSFRFHHNHCVGPWAEAFYIKRNVCIEFNYVEWTNTAVANYQVIFRHGLLTNNPQYDIGGIIRGNRFKGGKAIYIDVAGTGICITNNVAEGSASWILLGAGNGTGNFGENTPNRDGADNAQLVENTNFSISCGVTPAPDDTIRGETAGHRNGWPSNVRIYPGDSGWVPHVSRNPDPAGNTAPAPATMSAKYGTGMAAKCGTIAVTDLTGANPPVGCDPIT